MNVEILKAEEFDGQAKVRLRLGDGTDVRLWLCTTRRKIRGMFKGVLDTQFKDIPEQAMPESGDEWRY